MKFNAIDQPKLKDGEVIHALSEDAQIDVKAYGFGFQAKFKPNLLSLHTDFGLFQHVKKSKNNDKVHTFHNNPYLLFETTRGLQLNTLFVGNLFHYNNCFRNNVW